MINHDMNIGQHISRFSFLVFDAAKWNVTVKLSYKSSLLSGKFTYIEAYLEYESQSQGIEPQPLPKQRKIVVVRLQRTLVSCEKPEARTVAHLLLGWSEYPNIVTVNLFGD
jgi:hypothetical protein